MRNLLLVLGSPLWLPLLIVFFAVILVLCVMLFVVVLSLWIAFAAFAFGAVGGAVLSGILAVEGSIFPALAMAGAVLTSAGLAILWFFPCRAVTRGTLILSVWMTSGVKKML